jgi:Fe-S-cluster containining protein
VAALVAPLEGLPDPGGADCVACGRCCHHGPRTVHLLEADDLRLEPRSLARFTELDARPPGWRFMKNDGTRCLALDVSAPDRFPCVIYDARPDDCRLVEPGSPCCLEARRLGHLGTSVDFKRAL